MMDDLSATINQFLSNEDNVKQLKSLASAMGLSSDSAEQNNDSVQNSAGSSAQLAGLLSAFGGANNGQSAEKEQVQMPDMAQIMKLQKIFSSFSKEDDNIILLKALKPHLKEKNRKKVDDAIKIMQLISVLPMIKETGLFGGDMF